MRGRAGFQPRSSGSHSPGPGTPRVLGRSPPPGPLLEGPEAHGHLSWLPTGAQGRGCQKEEDGRPQGGRPTASLGSRAQWPSQTPSQTGSWPLGDGPAPATSANVSPPGPARECFFPGRGRSGFQVGVRGKNALTHSLSAAQAGTEPHSAQGRPPAWLPARIPGRRLEKSTQRARPAAQAPLHLCHILTASPEDRHTPLTRVGMGKDQRL